MVDVFKNAAAGMHWAGAERTAPFKAPTKPSLQGRWVVVVVVRGGVSVYLLYNLFKRRLGFSFSLQLHYSDAYTARFWKKTNEQ